MSVTASANTFIRAEEGVDTITVFLRTPEGEERRVTFGARESTSEYRATSWGQGWADPLEHSVKIWLLKSGETGHPLCHGGSHLLEFITTEKEATLLSHQLQNLSTPAQELTTAFRRNPETVVSVTYSGDYITVHYGYSGRLKLGLEPERDRFTLKMCGRMCETHESTFPRLYFAFNDETGKEQFVPFNARDSKIDALHAELREFAEAHERVRFQDVTG